MLLLRTFIVDVSAFAAPRPPPKPPCVRGSPFVREVVMDSEGVMTCRIRVMEVVRRGNNGFWRDWDRF